MVPKSFQIEHPSVTRRLFFLLLYGLDRSRYNKYFDLLPGFQKLSENGYPVTVLLNEKHGTIQQPESSILGYKYTQMKKYESYEEMIVSVHKLLDNNFPLPEELAKDDFVGKHRFEQFNIEPISKEVLEECDWLPEHDDNIKKENIVALDCEMIKTKKNPDDAEEKEQYELARLSVTDKKGRTLIDEIFKPVNKVIDLLTPFSGITEEMIEKATKFSNEGRAVLGTVCDKNTIIVGHGLENDFKALRLFHTRVIDTSLVYNNEKGVKYPRKPSLISLSKRYIGKDFREEGKSHDSVDDAKISFELAQYAKQAAVSKVQAPPEIPDLFVQLKKATNSIDVLTHARMTPYANLDEHVRCHLLDDDNERTEELLKVIKEESSEVVFAHYNILARSASNEEDEKNAAILYNSIVEQVTSILPPASVLFVYTGGGSLSRISACQDFNSRKAEAQLCRQGLLWIKITEPDD